MATRRSSEWPAWSGSSLLARLQQVSKYSAAQPRVPAGSPQGGEFAPTNASVVFENAVKRFGVTEDLRDAGWILPDGRLLNFNRRALLVTRDNPTYRPFRPHSFIAQAFSPNEDMLGTSMEQIEARHAAVESFEAMGALRMHIGGTDVWVEGMQEPSGAQMQRLREAMTAAHTRGSAQPVSFTIENLRTGQSSVIQADHPNWHNIVTETLRGPPKAVTLEEAEASLHDLQARFVDKFDRNQPRVPAGSPQGGEWVSAETVLGSKVGAAQGSNPGGTYLGKDNVLRYVKHYSDPAQAWGEHLANQLYRDLGLTAPQSTVFTHAGKATYASVMEPGRTELNKVQLTKELAQSILHGFAADVLTANWDAVGTGHDNILVAPGKAPMRVDQGGTFLMRAKAGRKPVELLPKITEFEGFANPSINPWYSKVVLTAGGVPNLSRQVEAITQLRAKHGDWGKYVHAHAPGLSVKDRAAIVHMLEKRTELLQQRLVQKYTRAQPRVPAGQTGGGQWTKFATSLERKYKGLTVDVTPHQGHVYLNLIEVRPDRWKKGIGTKAMKALTQHADEVGARMVLLPAGDDRPRFIYGKPRMAHQGPTTEKLRSWYRRFGFKDLLFEREMVRAPRRHVAKFDEAQPRVPAGSPEGGEWVGTGAKHLDQVTIPQLEASLAALRAWKQAHPVPNGGRRFYGSEARGFLRAAVEVALETLHGDSNPAGSPLRFGFAFEGDDLVAAGVMVLESPDEAEIATLGSIGIGKGEAVLRDLVAQAKAAGRKRVVLTATQRGRLLYERFGFKDRFPGAGYGPMEYWLDKDAEAAYNVTKYSATQPRAPAGSPQGGEWVSVGERPENVEIFERAKAMFPTNGPLKDTGWILPDGTRLNFHRASETMSGPNMWMAHGMVGEVMGRGHPSVEAIDQFIKRGAIRVDSGLGFESNNGTLVVDLMHEPTEAQWEVLDKLRSQKGIDTVIASQSSSSAVERSFDRTAPAWKDLIREVIPGKQVNLEEAELRLEALRQRMRDVSKFSVNQPRVPAGSPQGGEWAATGGASAFTDVEVPPYGRGHAIYRRGAANEWGASHGTSWTIAGYAGRIVDAPGYASPRLDDPRLERVARGMLEAIAADKLGAEEPLYHGFENTKHVTYREGDALTIPLMAASGDAAISSGYGVRLDPADQVGEPTVFAFPRGTPMVGYQRWSPAEQREFGYIWDEAIVGGRFQVAKVETRTGLAYHWKDPTVRIVSLIPTETFDPARAQWRPTRTALLQSVQKYSPYQPRDAHGRWTDESTANAPKLEDADHVRSFLHQLAVMQGPHEGWAHGSYQDFVLKNGEVMHGAPKPKGIPQGVVGQCFQNAFKLMGQHKDYTYVEGWARPEKMPMPFHHAWVVDSKGTVIDNTWSSPRLNHDPRTTEYFGVRFPREYVYRTALATGMYGLYDNYQEGHPLLKKGLAHVNERVRKSSDAAERCDAPTDRARIGKFDPNQPRWPSGVPTGGQWAPKGGIIGGKDPADPAATVWYTSLSHEPKPLNGIPFSSWEPPEDWAHVTGTSDVHEPPLEVPKPRVYQVKNKETGELETHVWEKQRAAGVVIQEKDGRVWLIDPSKGFAGVKSTFPKGQQEGDLTLQQTAIKEAYEESGLKVRITGLIGDVDRTTSVARYYWAEREGGTPLDHGWEAQAVRLVPVKWLHQYLNTSADRELAADVLNAPMPKKVYQPPPPPPHYGMPKVLPSGKVIPMVPGQEIPWPPKSHAPKGVEEPGHWKWWEKVNPFKRGGR